MIRTRKLRKLDGTLVGEVPESLRKAMESGAEAPVLTDAEEIERLQARVKQLEMAWKAERFETERLGNEITMLRERLTRWAKVITEMYEMVTREILF